MDVDGLLTLDEVARVLEVSRVRVWQILRGRGLRGIKRGNVWFVYPDSVRRLLEKRSKR